MNFNIDDYNSFYNVKVINVSKFEKIRHLTYEYRDYETGWMITEEQYITNNNILFFHLYDAVQYEYNINLVDEPFEYI